MHQFDKISKEIRDALEWGFDVRISDEPIDTNGITIKASEVFIAFGEDASGGVFFSGCETDRVLFVSSEGQAGVVAMSLSEFYQLIVSHPYWFDLLKFSGGGEIVEMRRAVPYLEQEELEDIELEITQARELVRTQLSIEVNPKALQYLYASVTEGAADIEVLAEDGWQFGSLFNTFTVESNPLWQAN